MERDSAVKLVDNVKTQTWLVANEQDNVVISAPLPIGYNIKHNDRKSRDGRIIRLQSTTPTSQ